MFPHHLLVTPWRFLDLGLHAVQQTAHSQHTEPKKIKKKKEKSHIVDIRDLTQFNNSLLFYSLSDVGYCALVTIRKYASPSPPPALSSRPIAWSQ